MSIFKLATSIREERSSIIDSYIRNVKGSHNKKSMKEVLDDLIARTGLSEHIQKVQADIKENTKIAQQQVNQSLLNVPYIKDAIEKSIQSKKFTNYIDLLNDLQKIVIMDQDIPKDLEYVKNNVHQDKQLVEFLKERMPNKNSIKYDLGVTEAPQNVDPSKDNYYNFTEDNKDKPAF